MTRQPTPYNDALRGSLAVFAPGTVAGIGGACCHYDSFADNPYPNDPPDPRNPGVCTNVSSEGECQQLSLIPPPLPGAPTRIAPYVFIPGVVCGEVPCSGACCVCVQPQFDLGGRLIGCAEWNCEQRRGENGCECTSLGPEGSCDQSALDNFVPTDDLAPAFNLWRGDGILCENLGEDPCDIDAPRPCCLGDRCVQVPPQVCVENGGEVLDEWSVCDDVPEVRCSLGGCIAYDDTPIPSSVGYEWSLDWCAAIAFEMILDQDSFVPSHLRSIGRYRLEYLPGEVEQCREYGAVPVIDVAGYVVGFYCSEPSPVAREERQYHTCSPHVLGLDDVGPQVASRKPELNSLIGYTVWLGAYAPPRWAEAYYDHNAVRCEGAFR